MGPLYDSNRPSSFDKQNNDSDSDDIYRSSQPQHIEGPGTVLPASPYFSSPSESVSNNSNTTPQQQTWTASKTAAAPPPPETSTGWPNSGIPLRRPDSSSASLSENNNKDEESPAKNIISGNDNNVSSDNVNADANASSNSNSNWKGAGVPRPELLPEELPSLMMKALKRNNIPRADAGLQAMWDFAGEITHGAHKHDMQDFVMQAHRDVASRPASFYGMALEGISWQVETPLTRVGGPEGYLASQIIKTTAADGRTRRWQFMLKRNRRPPNLHCWVVENIGSSAVDGNFYVD
jgi:hypothetical protein